MNERMDRFINLLKEIFELDKSDLNFGIYRVMNLRKTQIEQFLSDRLPQMVQETLSPFAQGSKEEIRLQMTQIEESVAEMGMTVDALPETAPKKQKYAQLKKQLAEGTDLAALETDVYSNISDDGRIYQSVSLRAPEYRTDEKFHRPLMHPITKKPCPVPYNGFSRKPETLQMMIDRGDIIFGEDETIQPRYKMYLSTVTKKQLNSVIYESKKGTTDLKKMGLSFPYCHAVSFYDTILTKAAKDPDDIVLDFFAGSGTTGHAIVNDNRNNDNAKKYILIEMGEYFDTVTKPRMLKVVYSADWKDGKPQNRTTGIPQIIKYMCLESYEDALSNIELTDNGGQLKALLGEEYMIHYMVDLESRGSLLDVEAFANPFAYTMKITEKNECKERPVDRRRQPPEYRCACIVVLSVACESPPFLV